MTGKYWFFRSPPNFDFAVTGGQETSMIDMGFFLPILLRSFKYDASCILFLCVWSDYPSLSNNTNMILHTTILFNSNTNRLQE